MPKQKEKRDAVLYTKVKTVNKEMVEDQYKKKGYPTMSEYIDEMLSEHRTKISWKKSRSKK